VGGTRTDVDGERPARSEFLLESVRPAAEMQTVFVCLLFLLVLFLFICYLSCSSSSSLDFSHFIAPVLSVVLWLFLLVFMIFSFFCLVLFFLLILFFSFFFVVSCCYLFCFLLTSFSCSFVSIYYCTRKRVSTGALCFLFTQRC